MCNKNCVLSEGNLLTARALKLEYKLEDKENTIKSNSMKTKISLAFYTVWFKL